MSKTQVFAPAGRMNQDDSIINPTPNYAGENAFAQGDYKYLLNARVATSRSDNANALETLKSTVEKGTYYVRANKFINSDFASGLTGWSQTGSGTPWVLGADVRCDFAAGVAASSQIIYQSVSPTGKPVGIRVKTSAGFLMNYSSARIVYLQGTTVLSFESIFPDLADGTANPRVYVKYINKEPPAGCDGVGFQVLGFSSIGSAISITEFKLFDWEAGAKPSGTEKVIGKYENAEFSQIFYCVYNSSNNYCIRAYEPSTEKIYEILQWTGLDFLSTYFECMVMVDNFLGITDRNNAPRMMDIYSIADLKLILGSDFREYHISFHKWAPVMPPVIRGYWDGVTNNYKKLENKNFQFSYRYIYQNKLRSRFSPISNPAQSFKNNSGNEVTAIEVFIPGFNLDDPGAAVQYNYFGNDDTKFFSCVEAIEIAFREGERDVWKILKRYNVRADDNTVFRYSGDSDSTPIASDDFSQLFDVVPFKAGVISAIDNRFMFADCLDEKDIAPAVQVTDVAVAKFDANTALSGWWNFGNNNQANAAAVYTGMSASDALELALRNLVCQTTFKSRGLYKLGIQYLAENGWRSAVYTADEFIIDIPEETGIVDKLYAIGFKLPSSFVPPDWAVAFQIMRTNCLNIDYFMFGAANDFVYLIDDTTPVVSNTQFTQEVRDRIRQHYENARLVSGTNFGIYPDVLKNKPFYRSLVSDVRKTTTTATLADASRLSININNWYNSSKKDAGATQNNPLNNLFYNYREGDRVRFIGSTASATPADNQKIVFDVPILEYNGLAIIIEKPDGILWLPGDNAQTDPENLLIEVYSPKTPSTDDYLYHESGEWYPVLYPGTDQRDFAKRDWTFSNAAGITCSTYGDIKVFNKRPFSYGDCHGILKTYYYDRKSSGAISASAYSASMNPDPDKTYDFWEQNAGRSAPGYSDLPVVKFKQTQVRFGGQVVEESLLNQLNRFKEEDQKIYPSEYGKIRAMVNTANAQVESVGAILLAIGEKETFSIYVNRTTLEDLSGRTQVSLSDKVLGSYNTLLGSHGTLNPESVSVRKGRVYYWDASDGEWIRYGRDGLTEISSEYKMMSWFKELGSLLRSKYGTSEQPLVISGFDNYSDELVTYMNHSTLPATLRSYSIYKNAVFSEAEKGWKIINYTPEMFAGLDDDLYSFKEGKIYKHEAGSDYLSFYGVKQDVYIEPVFNEMPKDIKSWQNMAYQATHGWSAERILSEYLGATTKQQCSIALNSFQRQEFGRYVCDIPMNVNTPNVSNPAISGNKMRSKAIQVLMKLDPSVVDLSLLHFVEAGQIDSPKNP